MTPESFKSLLIKMYFDDVLLSSGTAFIVKSKFGNPLLITNRHNVTGRNNETNQCLSKQGAIPNRIEIYHNKNGDLGSVNVKSENLYKDENIYKDENQLWIEHPTFKSAVDFVALKLTDLGDVAIYDYLLEEGSDIRVDVADIVSVIGFPFGLQVGSNAAIWATGFVASEPVLNFRELPLFLIDCRSRQGQSGSAVVSYHSNGMVNMCYGGTNIYGEPITKFLGIYSGRINGESDIGLVWKASAIGDLVNSID